MNIYSIHRFGAGITQLVECQLPKLNVAGSIPVTRSGITLLIVLITVSTSFASFEDQRDFWLEASGFYIQSEESTYWNQYSERMFKSQLKIGNRKAFIPFICFLINSGRINEAEMWMEGRGSIIPVTRRDLGIALSWYGRFQLYTVISDAVDIPPDLQNDDYGLTLTAVLSRGWMHTSPDGNFHPDAFIGTADLERLSGIFFPSSFTWEQSWIGMNTLDSLFKSGIVEGGNR